MSVNPFSYNVLPVEAPFCGRDKELDALCNYARANTNVVLYSPRRYGKTSLIKRVQDSLTREQFITLYIDISGATSAEDLASLIARDIFRFVQQKSPLLKKAMSLINNWRPSFTPQPDGSVSVSVQPSSQKTGIAFLEETLDGLDNFLSGNPQQTSIVIDEFQEITELKNSEQIEALLRKHIQHQSNCSWFFLGSRRRMLLDMFEKESRPFYRSAIKMQLPPLPQEEAIQFVIEQFGSGGKACPRDIASKIIDVTHAYPFYVQRLSGEIFTLSKNNEIGEQELQEGVRKMLDEEGRSFANVESHLAAGQKRLLRAIAKEPTDSLYAIDYQRKHRLGSLSTIQAAIKKLLTLDHIEQDEHGVKRLTDPMFALWLIGQEQELLPEKPASIEKGESLPFGQTLVEYNVEQSLKKGIGEMPDYRSTEAVEIKASLPEEPDGGDERPRINVFLSYAHDDQALKERFFDLIRKRLKTSKEYRFSFSSDNDLICGTHWHDELQERIDRCDFGLMLVSTSFLASAYIQDHEVPKLKQRCFPVFLKSVDMDGQDLRGLEKLQIFQFQQNKSFEEVRGANQTKFINNFARHIEARVKVYLEQQKQECISLRICDDDGARKITEGHLKFKGSLYECERFIEGRATKGIISNQPRSESAADTVQARPYILNWALETEVPFFALLGDFGTGKTFTCRMLAREINAKHDETPESVPLCIYIDLRRVSTRVGTEKKVPRLTDILRDAIEFTRDPLDKSIVTPEDIIRLVRLNRALIIFDGLDEKTVHFTPEETNQFIAELWSIREQRDEKENPAPQGKILISCRTHYFRDTIEQNTLFLGRDREGRTREEYRSCTLLPFDTAQISEYLEKRLGCDRKKIDRIVKLFEEVHNLKDLASRPYTLNLVTESIPDIERKIAEGVHVNTATLYDTTVDNWLARDEGKHEFSTPHKKRLMKSLAAELHNRGGEGLETDELDEWLDDWLYRNPVIKDAYAGMNRETLKKDLRTATFIIREEEDSFSFAHTSLQEYFLAGFIVDALSARQFEPQEVVLSIPSKETLDFVTDMLDADDRKSGPVIASLASILETAYHKQVSELAFALWLKLHENGMRTPAPRNVHLEHAELDGWVIGNLNLSGARFDHANLRSASFRKTILVNASFRHANLVNAEFLGCNSAGSDYSQADAIAGIWRNTDLHKSRWTSAELRLASFVECQASDTENFPEKGNWVAANSAGMTNSQLPAIADFSIYDSHAVAINKAKFNSDGTMIVSTSHDGTIKVWDVQSEKCMMTLTGHTDSVNTSVFNPDSTIIASASNDKTLKLWDAISGKCLLTLSGHCWMVNDCAFNPDGTRVISASADNTIKIWDVVSGTCLFTLSGHSSEVNTAEYSPDGQLICSASQDGTIKLWDAQTGKCLSTLKGHSATVWSAVFSNDGRRIVSAASDKTLIIWDTLSRKSILKISAHSDTIWSSSFSPDGSQIISISSDNTLKRWDTYTGKCLISTPISSCWPGSNNCAFSPDGKKIIVPDQNSIKLFEASSSRCLMSISKHGGLIRAVAFNSKGSRVITASNDHSIKLWEAQTGRCIMILSEHSDAVSSCAFSPDGTKILSASDDQTLKLWDALSGKCISTMIGHESWINDCTFSPDGTKILSASMDRTLRLWDTYSRKSIMIFKDNYDHVRACAYSPDGTKFLSASHGYHGTQSISLKVWDANTGKIIAAISEKSRDIMTCSFSPDGTKILSATLDSKIKLWDIESRKCLMALEQHTGPVWDCVFSPDGTKIASASSDNTLKIWDTSTGFCLQTLSGHTSSVFTCGFNTDGSRIISGSSDKTIKLWDAETGTCLMTMANLPDNETAAWSETELKLLWASPDAWRWIGLADGCRRLPIELLDDPH
jgi:WD40 repeat protein/AAA+ ATPase superfamily predicted ATPase